MTNPDSVVSELARSLDLNTLHALSRTCHQFRAILLQSRAQLIARSLRCENERPLLSEDDGEDQDHSQPRYRSWDVVGSYGMMPTRITSGKVGPCARDMVGDCRRCGRIVCRNCTMKPPSAINLPNRLRRLCSTCNKAPLHKLVSPNIPPASPPAFTYGAFVRESCSCREFVFICQPCGQSLPNADTTYKRIWTWRTRYSSYLGGLGTGIGEGNEGVKCGRGKNCLAAQDFEVELDSGEEDNSTVSWAVSSPEIEVLEDFNAASEAEKAGYIMQEIEGIGGIVRKKIKRRVRVGRTVKEHVDEREKAEYLTREMRGESRAWCGWCDRVVPSVKDTLV